MLRGLELDALLGLLEEGGQLEGSGLALSSAGARRELAELRVPREPQTPPASAGPLAVEPVAVEGWSLQIDPATGDLTGLTTPDGVELHGRGGSLMGYRHESYDAADMARFRESYVTHPFDWALLDFDKPGLSSATTARSARWTPALVGFTHKRKSLALRLDLPELARAQLGGPKNVEMLLRPVGTSRLEVTLLLRDKPANRMPEAGFLLLAPESVSTWDYHKMGLWQPGNRIAANAGGGLQAVTAVRGLGPAGRSLLVEPLDAPLVGPATGDFMTYDPAPPDLSQGLRFNLYNNRWGTNFAMWWSGSLKARFVLTVTDPKG